MCATITWSPPKDWAKNRGLLGEVRQEYRLLDQKRRELAELPVEGPSVPVTPIELPVPDGPSAPSSGSARPTPAPAPRATVEP